MKPKQTSHPSPVTHRPVRTLSIRELAAVTGGLNPQPEPPGLNPQPEPPGINPQPYPPG